MVGIQIYSSFNITYFCESGYGEQFLKLIKNSINIEKMEILF